MITIPENLWTRREVLYKEMVKYMSHCYFPAYSDDTSLHEFAMSEFRRIRDTICRNGGIGEGLKLLTDNGTSPFDAVQEDILREILRRVRKDFLFQQICDIQKDLLASVARTVKNHSGYIDTLYDEDNGDAEFDDTPAVVFHRSGSETYYETATLLNLHMTDTKLYCTLHGDSDENIVLPADALLVECLTALSHWLEEHGFTVPDDTDIAVCDVCGSLDIQTQAWVDPNTHVYIGETEDDRDDNWCEECEEHNYFCSLAEFKERMRDWWRSADSLLMEKISGLRPGDFSSEAGVHDFAAACERWWESLDYNTQRTIWKNNNKE